MFFQEKTVKRLSYFLLIFISFLYFNQDVFRSFMNGFYTFSSVGDAGRALSFIGDYFLSLRFGHLFYFLPVIGFYFLLKYKHLSFNITYISIKAPLIVLLFAFLMFFTSLQLISDKENVEAAGPTYTDLDLYQKLYDPQFVLKKFGLLTYTQRDFFNLFRPAILTREEHLLLLDDYFEKVENDFPYERNRFSDILENKNLILIMAESLDTFAINPELTPTLYDIMQNYAYFENYYSPLYNRSTADTEFLAQTSIYPDKNVTLTWDTYQDNYLPYTLPRLFEKEGYSTYSFHDYTDYFYERSVFHPKTLGYDIYFGSEELGLLDNPEDGSIIFNHEWQSDLEMMKRAIPYFIEDDQFFVNMVTVSGHFNYGDNHEIASQNIEIVNEYELAHDITIDEEIKYYLAANIELDRAVEYLMDSLEEADKLDDTAIIIFGDHYAYGLDEDKIWEYDGNPYYPYMETEYKEEGNELDLHNVPFMIYSNKYRLNNNDAFYTEYFSSIDILPTIANLFDLELDYQYVFGQDAFSPRNYNTIMGISDTEPYLTNVVRFADMSFLNGDFMYTALQDSYVIYNEDIASQYLLNLNDYFITEYIKSLNVLKYDYFQAKNPDNN
jgi:phosphoglycerol transferase MdoB-like AlkP superfamily enzyme